MIRSLPSARSLKMQCLLGKVAFAFTQYALDRLVSDPVFMHANMSRCSGKFHHLQASRHGLLAAHS